MDLTLLEHTIKKECRACFDDFKHCFLNNPFGVYDKDILKATIQSEIVESLGKTTLKTFLHENISKAQFEYVLNKVQKYKQLTKKTAYNFGNKYI